MPCRRLDWSSLVLQISPSNTLLLEAMGVGAWLTSSSLMRVFEQLLDQQHHAMAWRCKCAVRRVARQHLRVKGVRRLEEFAKTTSTFDILKTKER